MNIERYWEATLKQDEKEMRTYFHQNAVIKWHNTNECFTIDDFIKANCEYPGEWDGEIERIECIKDLIITTTHVYATDQSLSFHVVSFIQLQDDFIISIDEYWGDDGLPPQWRRDIQIGKPIHE